MKSSIQDFKRAKGRGDKPIPKQLQQTTIKENTTPQPNWKTKKEKKKQQQFREKHPLHPDTKTQQNRPAAL